MLFGRNTITNNMYIVLDNLSPPAKPGRRSNSFRTTRKYIFISRRPNSSWLNLVELWFAKIQRDIIGRGVFTSVADLGRKLRRYIRAYEKQARPSRWTYTNAGEDCANHGPSLLLARAINESEGAVSRT